MFKAINGFTKKKMKSYINRYNNGTVSLNSTDGCAYRGKDGNRCAAGCFIPNSIYKKEMEGIIADELNRFGIKFPLSSKGMVALQEVHDSFAIADTLDMRKILCDWIDKNVRE